MRAECRQPLCTRSRYGHACRTWDLPHCQSQPCGRETLFSCSLLPLFPRQRRSCRIHAKFFDLQSNQCKSRKGIAQPLPRCSRTRTPLPGLPGSLKPASFRRDRKILCSHFFQGMISTYPGIPAATESVRHLQAWPNWLKQFSWMPCSDHLAQRFCWTTSARSKVIF